METTETKTEENGQLTINEPKLKYQDLILESLPDSLRFELELIEKETDGFTNEETLPIYIDNFNYLYRVAKDKYPACFKSYVPPPPPPLSEEALAAKAIAEKYKNKKK